MQENMIKLIAIDLDGTLLNRKGQIDEPTAKAVRRAAKQGTIIVISTGRPIEEVPEEQLNGIGVRYVVALNGAAIYKMPEGKCIAQRTMPAEQAASLIEELSRLEVYPDVFAGQMEYGLGDREEMLDRLPLPSDIRNYIRTHSFFIPDLPGFIRRRNMDILKISVSFLRTRDGSVLDFEEAEEILKNYEDLSVTSGGEHNQEITGSDVTKGSSMELLLKEESVTWDEVMAIGDSKNDLDNLCTTHIVMETECNDTAIEILAANGLCGVDNDEGSIMIFDNVETRDVAKLMHDHNLLVTHLAKHERTLEEYYIELLGRGA